MSIIGGVAAAAGVAGKVAIGALMARGKDTYLDGTDVLGAVEEPEVKQKPPMLVKLSTSPYWTSVSAGLTVAGILTAIGFAYSHFRGVRFDVGGHMRGPLR